MSGSSIAVFGSGAVGLSAIMAAKAVGATTIIAVDVHEERLSLALELGATHTINAKEANPVEVIKEITGTGVNFALETSGKSAVLRQAVDALTFLGVAGVIGAPPPRLARKSASISMICCCMKKAFEESWKVTAFPSCSSLS